LIYWQLLDSIFDLISNSPSNAAERLRAVTYAGKLERERGADEFVSQIAEFYQKTPRAKLTSLIIAHRMVNQAHELCGRSHYTDAKVCISSWKYLRRAGDRWEQLIQIIGGLLSPSSV